MRGTRTLVGLTLHRDRVALPAWIAGIAVMVVLAASSVKDLYPTQADVDKFARTVGDNPALVAIRGRAIGLDTLGGAISWQLTYFAMILAALMSILLVVRHTRADEEAGRTELVLASPVALLAPTVAALAVVGTADVLVGGLTAVGLMALGLPATGSLVVGASISVVGLVFAGVAAITAQLATTSRSASGLAGAVLGACYVVRGIGDVAGNWVSWLSPIGWAQAMQPYVDDRWWPAALCLAATIGLLAVAGVLLVRRDYGGGLIAPRPGPPRASIALSSPWGFAVRLQRAGFAAWTAGLFLLGLVYGSLGQNIQDLLDTSQQAEDILVQTSDASVVDSFFGTTSLTLALIGTAFTLQAIGRLRSEETAGRAEPVLATGLGRIPWALTHVAVAFGGTVVLFAAAGLGTGIAYVVTGAGVEEVPRLLGSAVAQTPAAWVLGSISLLLFGLLPRATVVAWIPLAFCFVIGTLGSLLGLPQWVDDLSPFTAQPMLPAEAFSALPLLLLVVLAAALAAVGLAGFRRRDIG